MPTLSRYFIKTGMLYLIAGLAMTLAMFLQPLLGWSPVLQAFYPVYLHFIFVGWVTQDHHGCGVLDVPEEIQRRPAR
ncbi:MAG: hypothetical protein HND48_20470 [Chloroflexi bacterium]|nr:hypothetical protein [Chloroflexota bacterium]